MNLKDLIFSGLRLGVRLAYSLPIWVRHLWRTLLVWGRISRIFVRSGMEGVNRKNELKQGKPPFPPYRG